MTPLPKTLALNDKTRAKVDRLVRQAHALLMEHPDGSIGARSHDDDATYQRIVFVLTDILSKTRLPSTWIERRREVVMLLFASFGEKGQGVPALEHALRTQRAWRDREPTAWYTVWALTNLLPPVPLSGRRSPRWTFGACRLHLVPHARVPHLLRASLDGDIGVPKEARTNAHRLVWIRADIHARSEQDVVDVAERALQAFRRCLTLGAAFGTRRLAWTSIRRSLSDAAPPAVVYIHEKGRPASKPPRYWPLVEPWAPWRVKPDVIRQARRFARYLAHGSSGTHHLVARLMGMYADALHLTAPWQQILALWAVLELAASGAEGRPRGELVVDRLRALVHPIPAQADAIDVLYGLRNAIAHEAELDGVDQHDVVIARDVAERVIGLLHGRRHALPTVAMWSAYLESLRAGVAGLPDRIRAARRALRDLRSIRK